MVKIIPRENYEENYQIYKTLLSYDPRNSKYLEKTRLYYHLTKKVLVITNLKKWTHMRSYPCSNITIIKIPNNTLVEVIGTYNIDDEVWYEVKWGKHIGWISDNSIVKGET